MPFLIFEIIFTHQKRETHICKNKWILTDFCKIGSVILKVFGCSEKLILSTEELLSQRASIEQR